SMDNPVEISEGTWISRTLHSDDEDWFLFAPASGGRYTAETSGGIDTCMELYGAENSSKIEEDDDGGDDYNALITFSAANGTSYLIKIRGYDGDTGQYRLRVRAGE
ncbi:MAG: peptidase, partial [Treponema sp.]|nr:peptidase [Treponema sp.]